MSESAAMVGAVSRGRLVVRAVLRTDVGKVRSENQDFGTMTSREEESAGRPGGRLLIVADGMGGHRGGATASRLAAETVKRQYISSATDDVPSALREALIRANARIFSEAQSNPDLRGMGTTTSALAVRENQGWFAHVGDSRIYLVRDGAINQLTDDHSLVASMVREGLLTSDEAANHPRRNVLQRSMGVGQDVEIDVRGPFELREGDVFILCSDGLHGVVKEDELRSVASELPIEQGAEELLRRALDRGAPDNVTVIVARVERADSADDDLTVVDHSGTEEAAPFEDTLADTMAAAVTVPGTEGPLTHETVSSSAPTMPGVAVPPVNKTTEIDMGTRVPAPPPPVAAAGAAAGAPRVAAAPLDAPDPWLVKPAKKRSTAATVLKWALLFVVVLGAAGGWLLYTQQQKVSRTSSSSGR